MIQIGPRSLGRKQHQPAAIPGAPLLESRPGIVAHDRDLIEVIHARPAEMAIGDRKPGRLDDMRLHIEAGTQAENRPGVLRNVGLKKRNPHSLMALPVL